MEPRVTIIRPTLTPEERETRMAEIRKAIADFVLALARADKAAEKEEGKTA